MNNTSMNHSYDFRDDFNNAVEMVMMIKMMFWVLIKSCYD